MPPTGHKWHIDALANSFPVGFGGGQLINGWPIASGVIEGTCRHFMKDHCELSGMRWMQIGAKSLLHPRAIAEDGDWDAYHTYRKAQSHIRLYSKPWLEPKTVVFQKIDLPTTALKVIAISDQQFYAGLPLAA